MLGRLGLLQDGAPTRAATLLFGVDPQREFPGAVVRCVQYRGTDRSEPRHSGAAISGCVHEQIDAAHAFVRERVPRREHPSDESARSAVAYDYPMKCVREVLVNALVHRDYTDAHRNVHVRIYTDRMEILSPGTWYANDRFRGEVELRRLESQSVKRNPVLAETMSLMRYFEGEGSGLPAAVRDADDLGAPEPTVRFENGFVVVTIFPLALNVVVVRRRTVWAVSAAAVLAIAAAVATGIIIAPSPGEKRLVVYSSLPARAASKGAVVRNDRTRAMEDAMRLALSQAAGKAGDFNVALQSLDDSDSAGQSSATLVRANASRAASDQQTAVYVGDFSSTATQQSIPILSRARVAQISPSSTRVGLTKPDPQGDVDEPDRYYPTGYRNFVRITPDDAVIARALLAVLAQTDGCERVGMVSDNSSHGENLSSTILSANNTRVRFVFNQSVGPYQRFEGLVVKATRLKPDCFVYSGGTNPNTVEIFDAIGHALPNARLYGTDGVAGATFSPPISERVTVLRPPYDAARFSRFAAAFREAYGREPGPDAAYGYEAMRLALDAISRSTSGKRDDIVKALFDTNSRRSVIGTYSITATGDTNMAGYGVSRFTHGQLSTPARTPALRRR